MGQKAQNSRTETIINYRLEIMVDKQIHAQKHTCAPAHNAYINLQTVP